MDGLPVAVVAFTDMSDIKIVKISAWMGEGSLKILPQMRNYWKVKDIEGKESLFFEDVAPRSLPMIRWMVLHLLHMVSTS